MRIRPAVAAALLAPVGFVLVLVLVVAEWSPLRTLDHDVVRDLHDVTAPRPALVTFWKAVSLIGTPFTWQVVAVLVAVVLWSRGHARLAVFTAGTVVLAGLISNVVKALVGRDRPVYADTLTHAGGSSFPSGHATTSIVGAIVLLTVALPRVAARFRAALVVLGVLVVLAIGLSRLSLGVHYPSDVTAGWLLGTSWALLARWCLLTGPGRPHRPAARSGPAGRRPGTPVG